MTVNEKLDKLLKINEPAEINYPYRIEGIANMNEENAGMRTAGIVLYYKVDSYTHLDFSDFTSGTWLEIWEISGFINEGKTVLSSGRNGFYGTYPDMISISGYEYIRIQLLQYNSTMGSSNIPVGVDLTKMKFVIL